MYNFKNNKFRNGWSFAEVGKNVFILRYVAWEDEEGEMIVKIDSYGNQSWYKRDCNKEL